MTPAPTRWITPMRRRDFITLAGGVAAWPLAARAEQRTRAVPVIGFLHPGLSDGSSVTYAALIDGLREIGYVDGETIKIEARWGQGKPETMPAFARELAALKVDVIVAIARPAIAAARAATTDIPIIALDLESDPVASGFAKNLAKPSGNLTGLFLDAPTLCGKWLQLIEEVVPRVSRVAVLWDSTTGPYQLDAIKAVAQAKSVDIDVIEFHELKELDRRLDEALKDQPQALIQLGSPLTNMAGEQIVSASRKHGVPGISQFRSFAQSGGLMSYGPDLRHMFRRAAPYISRILAGAKVADLPIERPTKFELVINTKAAKSLRLEIPSKLLFTADEVIE
jgi:putative tryptophan/tyrosine transport system substrate-binding protein